MVAGNHDRTTALQLLISIETEYKDGPQMFTSKPDHYTRNISDGEALTAAPAYLTSPDSREPGVAILAGSNPRFVLREDHAVALANAIVDALEIHRNGHSQA